MITEIVASTSDFVSHKFARLDLSNAAEQTLELFLRHVLREVVHNQIGFTVLGVVGHLHRCRAVVGDTVGAVAGRTARPVGQLSLHGCNHLL